MAQDSVQTKARDVLVTRSRAGEMRIGFVISRDYPFSWLGTSPAESDLPTAASASPAEPWN